MLTTAILQTLAPGTAGLVTTSPHHPFITVYVGTCYLPLGLIVSWMQALPASGGGKQGYGYTPQIKDACGNRAAVCYNDVLHSFMGTHWPSPRGAWTSGSEKEELWSDYCAGSQQVTAPAQAPREWACHQWQEGEGYAFTQPGLQ